MGHVREVCRRNPITGRNECQRTRPWPTDTSSMPVASGSATHVAPAPVPTASSIDLSEGRTLNVNVNWGENDPAKKPPPVKPKKAYNEIVNWWEGCPYCDAIPKSYDSYRQHVSYRCKNRPNQTD